MTLKFPVRYRQRVRNFNWHLRTVILRVATLRRRMESSIRPTLREDGKDCRTMMRSSLLGKLRLITWIVRVRNRPMSIRKFHVFINRQKRKRLRFAHATLHRLVCHKHRESMVLVVILRKRSTLLKVPSLSPRTRVSHRRRAPWNTSTLVRHHSVR